MNRSTKLACAGIVVGLLIVQGLAAPLRAESEGWKGRPRTVEAGERSQASAGPDRRWKPVPSEIDGPHLSSASGFRSQAVAASLPPRRRNLVGAQLGRLHAFRPTARRNRPGRRVQSDVPRRFGDPAAPVRQADADWDTLETDPPATPPQPEAPLPPPEPAAPAPTPIERSEPAEPTETYRSKDIREISPRDILPDAGMTLPEVVPVPSVPARVVDREIELFHWEATAARNYPLYFEDMPLERYGHSLGCLQPLWSTGQFYAQVLLLPYEMGLDPPHKPLYALGYHRPGDCVERLWYQIPVNKAAVLSEAAAFTLFPVVFP